MKKKATKVAPKKASQPKRPARRTSKRDEGEEIYASLMGPAGRELYRMQAKARQSVDAIDVKNPSPQAIAKAAGALSGLLDTFINCIQLQFLVSRLEAIMNQAAYALTETELAQMRGLIKRAKDYIKKNCTAKA